MARALPTGARIVLIERLLHKIRQFKRVTPGSKGETLAAEIALGIVSDIHMFDALHRLTREERDKSKASLHARDGMHPFDDGKYLVHHPPTAGDAFDQKVSEDLSLVLAGRLLPGCNTWRMVSLTLVRYAQTLRESLGQAKLKLSNSDANYTKTVSDYCQLIERQDKEIQLLRRTVHMLTKEA